MKPGVLVFLIPLVACGGPESFSGPLAEPVEVDGALLFLDGAESSGVIVDPDGRSGPKGNRSLYRIPLGERASGVFAAPSPDDPSRQQAIVVDPGSQTLFVVRDRRGDTDAIDVGVPLEEVAIAPGGRYAVAFQREGTVSQQTLFSFPNAVAVVDLSVDSPGARTFELGAGGVRPQAVELSEPFEVEYDSGAGLSVAELQLALVFVQGGIVPIDLLRGESGPFVPLAAARDTRPVAVEFSNNRGDDNVGRLDGNERAYVRTDDGQLFVLAVSAVRSGSGVAPLVALENVVTPDRYVYDFDLFFSDDGRDLLLAAIGSQVVLVDGYTGVAERFDVPGDVRALRAFDDPRSGQRLALGFARASDALYRLDPFALDQRRASGIETVLLGATIDGLMVSDRAHRAILTYSGARELGVLDLSADGGLVDLRFASPILAMALQADGEQLLVVGTDPFDYAPRLAAVRLEGGLGAEDVPVAESVRSVGSTARHLWVDHFNAVTFFPRGRLQSGARIRFEDIDLTQFLTLPNAGER